MAIATAAPLESLERGYGPTDARLGSTRSATSAVSWGAIVAGAAAGAALSLILLILGVGLGLSSVSPWASEGISAATFGMTTIAWLTLTQILSSGMGGYLAGRLRTKWMDTPRDEVYFRDTAHGLLSWAVASLATVALLTSAIGSMLSGGLQAGASVVGGVASTAGVAAGGLTGAANSASGEGGPMAYFVDSLFRRDTNAAAAPSSGAAVPAESSERTRSIDAAEISRIFTNVSLAEPLPAEDTRYVAQLVAQRTGVSQEVAEARVTDIYTRAQTRLQEAEVAAKDTADKARKASAYAALWIFVSLLIGAFVASLAATYGGQQRDA